MKAAAEEVPAAGHTVHAGDNLSVLRTLPDGSAQLVYVDPPFNTGQARRYTRLQTVRDDAGDRLGFGGARYATRRLGTQHYADQFDDYLGWLEPRLVEAWRVQWTDAEGRRCAVYRPNDGVHRFTRDEPDRPLHQPWKLPER